MSTIRPEAGPTNQPTKKRQRRSPVFPPSAMSIPEFCDRHRISQAFFYLLKERGKAPKIMELGHRRLITVEEAARWREERTAASAVEAA
jgi:hypothetical protein